MLKRHLVILLSFLLISLGACSKSTVEDKIDSLTPEKETPEEEEEEEEDKVVIIDKPGELIWEYTTQNDIDSNLVILDNLIYFTDGFDENLYAVDINSGQLVWKTAFENETAFGAGPIIKNDTIYLGNRGGVYAVDPKNGDILWENNTLTTDGKVWVEDNKVFVSSQDGVYALNTSNGSQLWHFFIEGFYLPLNTSFFSGPIAHDNKVYAGSTNGWFYCFDSNSGEVLWEYDSGTPIGYSPSIYNDLVIFGNGRIINARHKNTGEEIWKSSGSGVIHNDPLISNDRIFVSSLYPICLDANTGENIWEERNLFQRDYHAYTVYQDEVYLSSTHGQLIRAVDVATGNKKSNIFVAPTANQGGISTNLLIENGIIYFGSKDNKLYAVKLL